MSNEELQKLTGKISIKQLNGMSIDKEAAELYESLYEKAESSDTLSSAIGRNQKATDALDGFIKDDTAFSLYMLERMLEFGLETAKELSKELKNPSSDAAVQRELIDKIATMQWRFNTISKKLTSDYRTTEKVSTYDMISPYMEIDADMVLKELKDYEDILKSTKDALTSKDLKALYKCNADIMTVSTNIVQYIYTMSV